METKVNSNAKPQTVSAPLRGDVSYGKYEQYRTC